MTCEKYFYKSKFYYQTVCAASKIGETSYINILVNNIKLEIFMKSDSMKSCLPVRKKNENHNLH